VTPNHTAQHWSFIYGDACRALTLHQPPDNIELCGNLTGTRTITMDRCDGFYDVYAALRRSPHAQQALGAWFPRSSGLAERIGEVYAAHPEGFVRLQAAGGGGGSVGSARRDEGEHDVDLAMLQLKRYQTFRRAKAKAHACSADYPQSAPTLTVHAASSMTLDRVNQTSHPQRWRRCVARYSSGCWSEA